MDGTLFPVLTPVGHRAGWSNDRYLRMTRSMSDGAESAVDRPADEPLLPLDKLSSMKVTVLDRCRTIRSSVSRPTSGAKLAWNKSVY